jgi:hypothetical protein
MHGQIGWRVPAGDIYSKMILISMIPAREGSLILTWSDSIMLDDDPRTRGGLRRSDLAYFLPYPSAATVQCVTLWGYGKKTKRHNATIRDRGVVQ